VVLDDSNASEGAVATKTPTFRGKIKGFVSRAMALKKQRVPTAKNVVDNKRTQELLARRLLDWHKSQDSSQEVAKMQGISQSILDNSCLSYETDESCGSYLSTVTVSPLQPILIPQELQEKKG
jgi:hypothetical protein